MATATRWPDLSHFDHGCLDAASEEASRRLGRPIGFADWSGEALEAILKDCERFLSMGQGWNDAEDGRRFWQIRTRRQIGGGWHPHFPPLTIYLDDHGKVRLREPAQ